jgi:periplasmic divalent cation tolerance protein
VANIGISRPRPASMTDKRCPAMLTAISQPCIYVSNMDDPAPQFVMIYCTCPDQTVAESIATQLVDQGLAGCVNCVPGLTSLYKWEGELKTGTEVLLLIKTQVARCKAVTEELARLHPYELPEIIAVPIVAGHQPYLDWIKDCTE